MMRAALLAAAGLGVLAACTPPPPVAYPLAPLERSAQCIAQLATGIIPTRLWADHDAAGYWVCPDWALDRTRQALADAHINLATYGQQVTVIDQPLGGASGRWLAEDLVIVDSALLRAGYGDEAPFWYAHETLGHPIAMRLGLTFEATAS